MKKTINNLIWDIKFVGKDDKNLNEEEDEVVCGITHFSRTTIYINKESSRELVWKTIVHELTHAFLWSYGFGQYESFTEENVCDIMDSFANEIINLTDEIVEEYFGFLY